MSESNDRQLGMMRRITRRDFLNGVARATAASITLPFWLPELHADAGDYPPALTGMRGSNDGSFEVAHQLRDGNLWSHYGEPEDTKETYDLVIVGAGVSGLSAAHFFLKEAGTKARVLLLDNHDDFGGHARRQEFTAGKSFLLTYGGSYAIESPAPYSKTSKALIEELGIDVQSFANHFVRNSYSSLGLSARFFFDRASFGIDRLVPDPFEPDYLGAAEVAKDAWSSFLQQAPMSELVKKDLQRLYSDATDYMPGLSSVEKKGKLARISYAQYLTDFVKCDPGIFPFFQARPHSLYGAGIDILPAQDAWGFSYPGFQGLNLDPEPGIGMNRDSIPNEEAQRYFYHFPDGNASIARLLVRKLIPEAIPGKTANDIVMARARYNKLDLENNTSRIRLSSTVVHVKQTDENEIEVIYVRKGKLQKIRASKCVLACWHTVIPYICPEFSREQKTALAYAIKVPLSYTRVAVRNWQPWVKLRVQSIYAPGSYFSHTHLAMPLQFDGYKTTSNPDEPMVIGMFRAPCRPGLPLKHQHRLGRTELLETDFTTFERNIREQLTAMLGPGGFDPAKDITGIAVHRWPHGYAYQYNSLFDPFWLQGKEGPCVLARKPCGRIAIANSDAGAYSYLDCAIDQAHRAVQEILAMK
ncbi:NAD(P)/FAD-dependent oxidoreductase [bacterium]|nr:NAD(P)/FAD-dependent oxidoreductase [bacterium]